MSEKEITFNDDIKPIFTRGFAVSCMKSQKNLDLSSYEDVKSNAQLILDMVSIIPPSTVPRMPPDPNSKERLSDSEVEKFKRWTETGFTKG